jgi:glycosyltransferase involved in cell wall biosynthesis
MSIKQSKKHPSIKVAHFNTDIEGGAAIAACRLHDSFVDMGIHSRFYYQAGKAINQSYDIFSNNANKYESQFTNNSFIQKIKRKIINHQKKINYLSKNKFYLENFLADYEFFGVTDLAYRTPSRYFCKHFNIFNLHWVSELIDYPSFLSSIPDSFPLVWTLHDMNPLTGGCHYSWDCEKYKNTCNSCPQISNSSESDLSFEGFSTKRRLLESKNLHIVSNSHWLESEAKKSQILSNAKSFQTIHYGLDTQLFFPRNKEACKTSLGIDICKTVILFGATSITNKRKGINILFEALSKLYSKNIVLLTFGEIENQELFNDFNFPIKNIGFVNSPTLLSVIYSSADIFVFPSIYEAFGQVALEAMSCQTPVVGFQTGGIPDMIRQGETGLLAINKSADDLSKQIQWAIDHPSETKNMGYNARKIVESEFTLDLQASKYISLYESLIYN